jgi:glyoxylase-like metal-dependent hydrolase (beta-lactamase superfamily II)
MEIAPQIHAVPLKTAGGFLITEDRLTLIDAGLAGSRPIFLRYLEQIGRSIDELDRIVCTHGHPDHVGGVRELADGTSAEVFIHPADLEGVGLTVREALVTPQGGSLRGRLLQAMTPHPGAATPLKDGDVLPVLGGLEVIHTPGHTPGSVCLYARGPRILFTGDVLQVRRGHLAFASPIFSHDHAQARASVKRLAHLDVDMIAFSHYRPMREGASDALAALGRQAAPPPSRSGAGGASGSMD